ncbi:MAG: ATP synthase F1 subunit gamma [Alphaproteobacteria bacterium]|nr:ATP synthase F1 subunit gamma [Alphaproteobacteria bacterium]
MAGLKELRNRQMSIKSTQKITSAMKMVASSRLRKAQIMVEKSKPYSQMIHTAVKRILAALREEEKTKKISYVLPSVLRQKPNAKHYLLFTFSSDRGLCGSYNQNVFKATVKRIKELQNMGKTVQVVCYGKKIYTALKKDYADLILEHYESVSANGLFYYEAIDIGKIIGKCCTDGTCDVCELVYSEFYSALSREMVVKQVYPLEEKYAYVSDEDLALLKVEDAYYDYEPDKLKLLDVLLPKLVVDNIFTAMVNSQASEQGARMTAMDNATRNAKDMIDSLTLKYNSMRQSAITTELNEIISGAEAL